MSMKTVRFARVLWLFALLTLVACPSGKPGAPDAAPTTLPTAGPAPAPTLEPPGVPQPPEPTPDLRTPAQIKQAACTAADGSWRCRNIKRATVLAAGGAPVIPTTWTIPAWFIDSANATTTASDANDCVTSATACRTYGEIAVHRWGTTSPALTQTTTITSLSPWPAAPFGADAVTIQLRGFQLVLLGTLGANETIASGVLAGVVAKATPNTLLQATLGAPTAVGQLIHNTTHDSYAYVLTSLGGGNFEITQPVVQVAPFYLAGAEVNTWANGDAYTVFAPDRINIATAVSLTGIPIHVVWQNVNTGAGPYSASFNGCRLTASTNVTYTGTSVSSIGNTYNAGNISISFPSSGTPPVTIAAGAYVGGNNLQGSFNFQSDWITTGANVFAWGGNASSTIWARGPFAVFDGTLVLQAGALYAGNQTFSLQRTGRVQWPSAQTAVNTFVTTAARPFLLNGATTACSLVLGTGVTTCGITVNQTNIDAAAGVAGFGGNVIGPFGARITNAAN
jgi:hypothetical protein